MATSFSHLLICQLDGIAGHEYFDFKDFVEKITIKNRVQIAVQMCQIFKLHYKCVKFTNCQMKWCQSSCVMVIF